MGSREYGGQAIERSYVPPDDIYLAGRFPVLLGGGYRRHALPLLWEETSLPGSPERWEREWRNTEWERKDWGKPQLGVISRPTDRKWVKRWQFHTPYTRVVERPTMLQPLRDRSMLTELETAEELYQDESIEEDEMSAESIVEEQVSEPEVGQAETVNLLVPLGEMNVSVEAQSVNELTIGTEKTSTSRNVGETLKSTDPVTQNPALESLPEATPFENLVTDAESGLDDVQPAYILALNSKLEDSIIFREAVNQEQSVEPPTDHALPEETGPITTAQVPQNEQPWSKVENEEDSAVVMKKEETEPHRLDIAEELVVAPEPVINETIHILGMGTAGKYIAHALASNSHAPPVTLLMHNQATIQQWYDEGAAIRVLKNGKAHIQSQFSIELSAKPLSRQDEMMGRRRPGQVDSIIETLIVTTEPNVMLPAIASIRHRLRPSSTICLVSDGLGMMDIINAELFPDHSVRPTYVLGCMTHRLASTYRDFTIEEKITGGITVSKLPRMNAQDPERVSVRRADFSWSPQAKHLMTTLIRTPDLNTRAYGHKSFYKSQLRRLAIGAVIGPLSVAFDCSNDKLLFNYNISQTMHFLIREISRIITSLPQLRNLPRIRQDFDPVKLEAIIVSAIAQTGTNLSSMLQDVRAGRRTDINFYNGYLAKEAARLGIDCPRNHMLIHMVLGKQNAKSKELNDYIPFKDN